MDVLLTSADLAARLWITVRILERQLAEAAIRGLKPGRSRLFTETDFQTLVAYLDQRPTNLAPRNPPGVPVKVRRAVARSATTRLHRQLLCPTKGAISHPKKAGPDEC